MKRAEENNPYESPKSVPEVPHSNGEPSPELKLLAGIVIVTMLSAGLLAFLFAVLVRGDRD